MGSSMFLDLKIHPSLRTTFKKFESFPLAKWFCRGNCIFNCIVNGNGIYSFGIHLSRFGVPTDIHQRAGKFLEPLGNMFYKLRPGNILRSAYEKDFRSGLYGGFLLFLLRIIKSFNCFQKDSVIVFKKGYWKEGVHPMHLRNK